ncbi:MAG: HD-GYP domain-containing protein [Clostridium sp.]|jgi:HD-GYP domain-containing protein (c-di-GMP phosphodiesterase class II)|uniref:HD-GYP domain-containing protein n=1 Tax=Clostridium sp. TaxID=1506 RepID=UPI0025BAD483|nr:HD-GYP domain-containing protein [Clostridium sp.]MCH3963036.1 HD-GYP domain-containing protein [Clostridium sp.]MCI1716501.1 HD-GYP domain-containing protein [Clostridium sp.]MCI1800841.1 HD-GYP domain-containing protein [Clostridium sp.]MCI1814504.1 HD-GYP domain-containing protein [Clostridium sp.]MCI1871414.1 HD-GYP domain-containing protein [Clostridium sp.]
MEVIKITESCKSIFNKTLIGTLLKDIKNYFNCNVLSIFNFNIATNSITLDKILDIENTAFKSLSSLPKMNTNKFYEKKLKQLYNYKEIIFIKKDDNTGPSIFFKNAKEELFIPMENKNDSIIFIYLCSLSTTHHINTNFVHKETFKYIMYSIINSYKIQYIYYKKIEFIFDLVNMMTKILKEKEPLLVFHPYNVADISRKIALQLKLNHNSIKKIYFAALLHDIGKLYINRNILNKPGKLTKNEYDILKKHSTYGYNLLKNIYPDIAIYIKYHHERIDGTGYPDNLKGSQIPLESKIISVADAIDAMSSVRSYNTPRSFDFVITELLHCANKQFDSKIVDTAIKVLTRSKDKNIYNLDNEIELGTLTIRVPKRSYSIYGTLRKMTSEYIFKSDEFDSLNNINIADIQDINLYIYKNVNNIYKYKVCFNFYKKNVLHIKAIHQIKCDDSFNIPLDITRRTCTS